LKNFEPTKRASSRSQQILSEKFNTPDVAKLTDEMNDEARMSNDEGNPNDETRKKAKCCFHHFELVTDSTFVIGISSLSRCVLLRSAATWSPTQACGSACRSF